MSALDSGGGGRKGAMAGVQRGAQRAMERPE